MTTAAQPLSVLIVDDNHDGADSLAMILRGQGHDARTAYSARDAGQTLQTGFCPMAVFMDIGLPDTDGYSAARELCAALPYRPLLVAITGHQHLDGRSDREGFDLHFLKPVDPTLLVKVLTIYALRDRHSVGDFLLAGAVGDKEDSKSGPQTCLDQTDEVVEMSISG